MLKPQKQAFCNARLAKLVEGAGFVIQMGNRIAGSNPVPSSKFIAPISESHK